MSARRQSHMAIVSKPCASSSRGDHERLTEHHAATARRDKDKALWKEGRSLGLASCARDVLPGFDNLAFNELCTGRTRVTSVKNSNKLMGITGTVSGLLTWVSSPRSRAQDGVKCSKHGRER